MAITDFDTLLSFFKVLANENRLKLVGILSGQECSVEELAALLKLQEPTVSHHLNKLKELHLVQMRPEGNTHLYRLNNEALRELNKAMFTEDQMATPIGGYLLLMSSINFVDLYIWFTGCGNRKLHNI